MAHALEVRCPFLDLDLLRFTATIPADVLIEGRLTKALLKRYAGRLVPAEVIDRPKRGFSLPLGDWLRHRCRGLLEGMLLGPEARARGWFEPKTVRTVLAEHLEGRTDHTHRLWTLLVFEVWCRLFVDGTLQPGDSLPYALEPRS